MGQEQEMNYFICNCEGTVMSNFGIRTETYLMVSVDKCYKPQIPDLWSCDYNK